MHWLSFITSNSNRRKCFFCYSFALFNIILGSFDFYALREVDPYLGPAFFMLFIFFIFFILVNMFLAIINDTYSEVKSELANQSDDFQISDYFLAVSQARTLLVRLVVVYTVDWFLVRFFFRGGGAFRINTGFVHVFPRCLNDRLAFQQISTIETHIIIILYL